MFIISTMVRTVTMTMKVDKDTCTGTTEVWYKYSMDFLMRTRNIKKDLPHM